eukprot:3563772-Pyramimonas_sp.AAC.1
MSVWSPTLSASVASPLVCLRLSTAACLGSSNACTSAWIVACVTQASLVRYIGVIPAVRALRRGQDLLWGGSGVV